GAFRTGVEPLHGAAADPERGLAMADPEQVDAAARPLGRNRRPHLEPVGRPQRAEAVAQRGIAVLERLGRRRLDAVDRPGHAQHVGIAGFGPDQPLDALAHLTDAVTRVLGVALHARATLEHRSAGGTRDNAEMGRREYLLGIVIAIILLAVLATGTRPD